MTTLPQSTIDRMVREASEVERGSANECVRDICCRVHHEIMNLPDNSPYKLGEHEVRLRVAYATGHRDARHAAAEIAQHAIAELERENAELREAMLNLTQGDVHFCNSALGNLLLERVRAERAGEVAPNSARLPPDLVSGGG